MTETPQQPDLVELVRVFARHGVEYLFVGGIAAQLQGAERPTFDVDFLTERSRANLDRLAAAMKELHARLRVEGLTDEEAARLPVRLDGPTLATMEISTWRTDAGDVDILADIPDETGRRRRYDELANRAVAGQVAGIDVRAAALDDVIASKEWAGRPKDHHALPELRALRDSRPRPPDRGLSR